jgi:hypothetical protein
MEPTKKEESKHPLDLTTEEIINEIFPPDVVEQLKAAANPQPKTKIPNDCGDSNENDSAYSE